MDTYGFFVPSMQDEATSLPVAMFTMNDLNDPSMVPSHDFTATLTVTHVDPLNTNVLL